MIIIISSIILCIFLSISLEVKEWQNNEECVILSILTNGRIIDWMFSIPLSGLPE